MRGAGRKWARFWMGFSSPRLAGRLACALAGIPYPPYYGKVPLSTLGRKGYFALSTTIHHRDLELGEGVFIGRQVIIYQDEGGEETVLGSRVHLHQGTILQNGAGGSIRIGDDTHIQPYSRISAYCGSVEIGERVEIAPNCSFYPYNHAMEAGIPFSRQPLTSRGDIVIGDDVWLGVGTTVLDGARIGKGAIVGAGSVVTREIPAGCIAIGVPARVIGERPAQ